MLRIPHARTGGFTLIELMLAVAIVGILMLVAAPTFRDAVMNVRISAQTNDLMADLALARSEAAKRNQGVYVCATSNGEGCNSTSWNSGWMVFPDLNGNNQWDTGEQPLKVRGAVEGNNTVDSVGHLVVGTALYIPYRPTGITGLADTRFVICDSRTTPNVGRRIHISSTGRPQVERVDCPTAP